MRRTGLMIVLVGMDDTAVAMCMRVAGEDGNAP